MIKATIKTQVLTAKDCTFISFEKKLPAKGKRASLIKEKVRKKWIESGYQPMPLPMIFIPPQTLENISKKLNKKPVEITINISDILSFNALKEKLIQIYAS